MDPEMLVAMEQQPMEQLPGGALTEEQVMAMMEENPEMLQGVIQAITQQQPQAAHLAQQNPGAFLSLLTQVLNQAAAGGHEEYDEQLDENTEEGIPVSMTEDEHDAVQGLVSLFPNIPQIAILQAVKACGGDSAMAANLLFEYDGEVVGG